MPLTVRALEALDRLPPRLDTPILFPTVKGCYIGLDTWRTREWYEALDAAGLASRGPYHLRHTSRPRRSRPASRSGNSPA